MKVLVWMYETVKQSREFKMTSDEPSIRERTNRKGYEGLFKVKEPVPTTSQVKCEATRSQGSAEEQEDAYGLQVD